MNGKICDKHIIGYISKCPTCAFEETYVDDEYYAEMFMEVSEESDKIQLGEVKTE
jgi:hypothetical protein